ncbi:hypothetical protein AAHA92_05478 [Salvia divinorum]|uniref:Uncharacterized protein n=1 Tax=Salvia divinorum TaxID=28513 RepID=A0ABD1I2J8_SALDI
MAAAVAPPPPPPPTIPEAETSDEEEEEAEEEAPAEREAKRIQGAAEQEAGKEPEATDVANENVVPRDFEPENLFPELKLPEDIIVEEVGTAEPEKAIDEMGGEPEMARATDVEAAGAATKNVAGEEPAKREIVTVRDDLDEDIPMKMASPELEGQDFLPPQRFLMPEEPEEEDDTPLKQREKGEGQTRPRGIDELEGTVPPMPQSPQSPPPQEEAEGEAEEAKRQRKRKGKMLAHLVSKKARIPSKKLVIQEGRQLTLGRNRVLLDESDEEAQGPTQEIEEEAEKPQSEEETERPQEEEAERPQEEEAERPQEEE